MPNFETASLTREALAALVRANIKEQAQVSSCVDQLWDVLHAKKVLIDLGCSRIPKSFAYTSNIGKQAPIKSVQEWVTVQTKIWHEPHWLPLHPHQNPEFERHFRKRFANEWKHLVENGLLYPKDLATRILNVADPDDVSQPPEAAAFPTNPTDYIEALCDTSVLDEPNGEFERKLKNWWWGQNFRRTSVSNDFAPPYTYDLGVDIIELQNFMKHEVKQGSNIWLYLRRFFIGGTGLKKIDSLTMSKNPQPATVLKTIQEGGLYFLGLSGKEEFSYMVEKAMLWGKLREDMMRDGYVMMANARSPFILRVQEYGMTMHTELPSHIIAQSPDGVVVAEKPEGDKEIRLGEIKCQHIRKEPWDKCPPQYDSQCISGMIAHNVTQCDFQSMYYLDDDKLVGEGVADPNTVQITIQRLYLNPSLKAAFLDLITIFTFYAQVCFANMLVAAEEDYRRQNNKPWDSECQHPRFETLRYLEQKIAEVQKNYRDQVGLMKREFWKLYRNPTTGQEVVAQSQKVDLKKVFFVNDEALYKKWTSINFYDQMKKNNITLNKIEEEKKAEKNKLHEARTLAWRGRLNGATDFGTTRTTQSQPY